MRKIPLLHGDPFIEEAPVQKCGALQNPLSLQFRRDGKKDLQIVGIAEVRMVAVAAFNNCQLFRCYTDRQGEGEGLAVEWTVGKGFSSL